MADRIESPAYLRKVRLCPCYLCRQITVPGVRIVEANHSTRNRGKGKRQGDGETWPLCRTLDGGGCHADYHDMSIEVRRNMDGPAVEWTRAYIAQHWPGTTIPPLDPPEAEILAPFSRVGHVR